MNGDRFTKSKRSDARTIGWMEGAIAYTAIAFQDYKRWNVSGMLEYQADHVRERTFRTPSLFSVVMRFEEDPPRDYTFSESCHTCRSPQPSSHSYSTSISLPHLPHPAISLRIFDGFFKFQPCRTGSYDQDHREEAGLTRIAFQFCAT